MDNQQVQRRQGSNHPKRSILYAHSHLNYSQLGELQKNVTELLRQNRKKYEKITEQRPDFSYQLYKVGEFQARAFGKELLLRQLDRLFEEKNYLDRQLSLIRFEKEQQTDEKEKMVCEQIQHFQLLRNIWKRDTRRQYDGPIEHVEELNLMVAQIKSNINSLARFQANQSKDFQETYLKTHQVLRERQCRKCNEFGLKNDQLSDKLQVTEEKLAMLSQENASYLEQLSKREEKLKRLTHSQLKQQAELKHKLIRLQQQLLKRDQSIKQLKKQIAENQANKIINEKEGFEIIFKGFKFDFANLQRKTTATAREVLSLFSKQPFQDLKSIQNDLIRFNCKSNSGSEGSSHSFKGSNRSLKLAFNEESMPEEPLPEESLPQIVVSILSESVQFMSERLCIEGTQKQRTGEKDESKQKTGQLEVGPKRYVRTGSRRSYKQTTNLQNDENEGMNYKTKGGPTFLPFLE